MLIDTLSKLEAAWLTVGILGALFALCLFVTVNSSYRTVTAWVEEGRLVRWGPRHKFALGFMCGIGLLFVVWAGFVALGVNAGLNAPPTTPDREAASERGGWILVLLELALLVFTAVLFWAWIEVGRPTLHPDRAVRSPVALMIRAIDMGREMGHVVSNHAQVPVSLIDEIIEDESLPPRLRQRATEAMPHMLAITSQVSALHRAVKDLEGAP